MRPGRLVLVVTVAAVLTGCPAGGPAPADTNHTPTSTAPSGVTGGSLSSGPSSSPAGPTDSTPSPAARSGSARLRVSGEVTAAVELTRLVSGVVASHGGLALVWAAPDGDTLGVGGPVFTGSRRTSTRLVVTILVAGRHPLLASSSAGECVVHLDEATSRHVRGRLACAGIRVGRGSVAARARFEATLP